MNPDLLKTGSCSIILGPNHYKKFKPVKEGKLLKVTEIREKHNEFKYLGIIRTIPNYLNYYSIPDETCYLLNPSNEFYSDLQKLVQHAQLTIFNGPLQCYYMDSAGDIDLLDSINDMVYYQNLWDSYTSILAFSKKIMEGLEFLHKHKICHLDVKPENIVINTVTRDYRLIDFGFSSMEPFEDFITNIKGTPCYFPKYYASLKIKPWLPKIQANDMLVVDGLIPMQRDPKMVYKIDSYCFGRVLYILKYIYKINIDYCCYRNKIKTDKQLDNIIESLLNNDVNTRLTIGECLERYFNS